MDNIKTFLDVLKDAAYDNAVKHGWHDLKHQNSHWAMMIITEISEAVQAHRKEKLPSFNNDKIKSMMAELSQEEFCQKYKDGIANTLPDELADITIRSLDFAGLQGVILKDHLLDLKEEEKEVCELHDLFVEKEFTILAHTMCTKAIELSKEIYNYEYAESIIQIINLAEAAAYMYGYDLLTFVKAKMRYNESRPFMHNSKY